MIVSDLDCGGYFRGWASNGDLSLHDMIPLFRIIFHLSVGGCDKVRVWQFDLSGSTECHLAVEVRYQDATISFCKANSANLSHRIVIPGKDMRLCGQNIHEPVLHDITMRVKSVHL